MRLQCKGKGRLFLHSLVEKIVPLFGNTDTNQAIRKATLTAMAEEARSGHKKAQNSRTIVVLDRIDRARWTQPEAPGLGVVSDHIQRHAVLDPGLGRNDDLVEPAGRVEDLGDDGVSAAGKTRLLDR